MKENRPKKTKDNNTARKVQIRADNEKPKGNKKKE